MNNRYYNDTYQELIAEKPRRLIDEETGEVFEGQHIIKKAYGQKAFWKLYLCDFLQVLGVLESKQIDVLIYILENTEPAHNLYFGSYRETAEGAKCSLETVRKVMKKLQEQGFIKKVRNAVYQVSPSIMVRGNRYKETLILDYYDANASSGAKESSSAQEQEKGKKDQLEGQMTLPEVS